MARKISDTSTLYGDIFQPCSKGSPEVHNKTKNLTGSERKVKDGAADLHNIVQKWKKTNTEGMEIIKTVANIKIGNLKNEDADEELNKNQEKVEMPQELEELCTQLNTVIHTFVKIIHKMAAIRLTFKGIAELHEYKEKTGGPNTVLFQSWTLQDFENTVAEILAMYKKEQKLKQLIVENICHAPDRNSMLFYTASWLHQPYIPDSCELLMESMLVETGHR